MSDWIAYARCAHNGDNASHISIYQFRNPAWCASILATLVIISFDSYFYFYIFFLSLFALHQKWRWQWGTQQQYQKKSSLNDDGSAKWYIKMAKPFRRTRRNELHDAVAIKTTFVFDIIMVTSLHYYVHDVGFLLFHRFIWWMVDVSLLIAISITTRSATSTQTDGSHVVHPIHRCYRYIRMTNELRARCVMNDEWSHNHTHRRIISYHQWDWSGMLRNKQTKINWEETRSYMIV